ncbi:MAG: lipopolysaccharide heptosyltransferase [Desulfuromonas sp.]|nr:MAG: lipopolysaccharide heptosyltransferase [Desulfuromonas sp.]
MNLLSVRNVLIVRPSAMGDVIMASPVLSGLKQVLPDARLHWLIDPGLADLIQHHPALDRVIPWSKKEWSGLLRRGHLLSLAGQIFSLRRDLRHEQFDLCLDLQGLMRSRLLAALSGAERRIGFVSKEPGEWLMHEVVSKGGDNTVIGSEYLFMAETLGIDPAMCRFELEPGQAARHWWRDRRNQDVGDKGYAVLAPFTTRPQKHWFEERWIELIARFEAAGQPCYVLGGSGDQEAGERLIGRQDRLFNLAGETSLAQSMAVVADAELVVGVDTGLTHLGTAFARPTVGLFGSTCPYLRTGRLTTEILYHPFDCSPCRRNPTCDGRFDCMRSLTVEEVLEAAHKAMGAVPA